MLYWLWNGFTDGVDITVVPDTQPGLLNALVPNPNGNDVAGGATLYRRLDHCEMRLGFKEPLGPKVTEASRNASVIGARAIEVAENVDICKAACDQAGATCKGIQIAPLKSPPLRARLFAAQPHPAQATRCRAARGRRGALQGAHAGAAGQHHPATRRPASTSTRASPTSRAPSTTRWTPLSTARACRKKVSNRDFGRGKGAGGSTFFVNSAGCVLCEDRKLYDTFSSIIPQWTVSASGDMCFNCDMEGAAVAMPNDKAAATKNELSFASTDKTPLSVAQALGAPIAERAGKACAEPAGQAAGTCNIKLTLLGAPANDLTSPEDCFRIAQRRGFSEVTYTQATSSCVAYNIAACGACQPTVNLNGAQSFLVPPMAAERSALVFVDKLAELVAAADPSHLTKIDRRKRESVEA